ncbi:LysR family transcriptional regulator [Shewanella waksmanii]|uniref:LysR family transcriptional regulator n=1 Tax=Shewanella waksmanii TaxID=213783 RepID=UPI00048CA4C5|nr:LysR family transcriptional regulator [Shewanella waksmanii]
MNFSLEQLITFVAVYEQRSFSQAAAKLDRHRTTVGQVITNLEDQLAIALFERVGRKVEPSEEATLLYHYANQVVEQARTFDKVALSLSYEQLASITIAYASFLPHTLLSHIRKSLTAAYPSMRVNFIVRTQPEIKQGIQDSSIHFGIVNVHKSKLINSIDFTFLGHMDFSLFVGNDHPLTQCESSEMLTAMKNSKQLVVKSLLDDDMAEKVILSAEYEIIDQLALVIKFVQEGLGWALLPRTILESEYVTSNLVEIHSAQIKDNVKVPIALWSPHNKQVISIKKTIVDSITSREPKIT